MEVTGLLTTLAAELAQAAPELCGWSNDESPGGSVIGSGQGSRRSY